MSVGYIVFLDDSPETDEWLRIGFAIAVVARTVNLFWSAPHSAGNTFRLTSEF